VFAVDCAEVESELVAYHFGTAEADRRAAIDEHLLGCGACLRAYQRVKHAFDAGGHALARPSPDVRQRLRREVLAAMTSPAAPPVRFWSRPVPLYQTVAAVCLAATVALVASSLARQAVAPTLFSGEHTATPRIDSSRPTFANTTVF
jgi:anti-sigma factor RsiW